MIAYVMVRRKGYGLKGVSSYLKRDPATVSVLISRLAARMEPLNEILRSIERLDKLVKISKSDNHLAGFTSRP
jgi:hypothetical protein